MNPMLSAPRTYALLVVLAALTGLGLAGLRAMRGSKGRNTAEYLLANRAIGWFPLAGSLFATTLWGILALASALTMKQVFTAWILPGFLAALCLAALGTVLASRFRETSGLTVSTFLSERYGRPVGLAVALMSMLLTLSVRIPLTVSVGSRLLSSLLGWDPIASALLLIVVPGLFAVAGGYGAVVGMQSAGAVVTMAGLTALLVAGVPGWSGLPLGGELLTGGEWTLLVAGGVVLGTWFLCVDQNAVQRVLAANSGGAIRRGAVTGGALTLLGTLVVAAGLTAVAVPGSDPGGPAWLAGGCIGAAILALGMASLGGHFMSFTSLFTMDLFQPWRKACDEVEMVLVGRLVATVVVIFAILAASLLALLGDISMGWIIRPIVALAPPLTAVTVLGVLWNRMHGRGAFWALMAGWAFGGVQAFMAGGDFVELLPVALAGFGVSGIVLVAVSLLAPPVAGGFPAASGALLEKGLQVRKP